VLVRLDDDRKRSLQQPRDQMHPSPFSVLDFRPLPSLHENDYSQDNWDGRLFHHYVTVVAPMMMPVEDRRNPWMTDYPRLASSQGSRPHRVVHLALLSQAAAHLFHLGVETVRMRKLAISYRVNSIRTLRECLGTNEILIFEVFLASILSLVMAEVYEGSSMEWRYHLKVAWHFTISLLDEHPWSDSEMAWLAAQSLCLLRLRTEVCGLALGISCNTHSWTGQDKALLDSVSERGDLGFTTGASPEVVACLEACNNLIQVIRGGVKPASHHLNQVVQLTERLLVEAGQASSSSGSLSSIHNSIFALGVVLYLHRQTIEPTPAQLSRYTAALLLAVEHFMTRSHRATVSVWPVFMAAVESYRQTDLKIAQSWLDGLACSGIGNRTDIIRVVQAVWEERSRIAAEGYELNNHISLEEALANVIVDWRTVMRAMNLDLLLV